MREGCDVMAGAPARLVPVNSFFFFFLVVGRRWAILMHGKGKVGGVICNV